MCRGAYKVMNDKNENSGVAFQSLLDSVFDPGSLVSTPEPAPAPPPAPVAAPVAAPGGTETAPSSHMGGGL